MLLHIYDKPLNSGFPCSGVHVQTGEEVGIKLVSFVASLRFLFLLAAHV